MFLPGLGCDSLFAFYIYSLLLFMFALILPSNGFLILLPVFPLLFSSEEENKDLRQRTELRRLVDTVRFLKPL